MSRAGAKPLRVERFLVRELRNLASIDFEPGPGFNVLFGDNGAGKSSLLEAIDYVGSLRSFRGGRTEDLIRIGAVESRIRARVGGESVPHTFEIALSREAPRRIALDQKRPRSIAAWHGAIQVVMFHPGDIALVAGGADVRRAFLDRILEQMDATYASTRAAYERALRSRNRLLKLERFDRASIVAFDAILAESGAVIAECRADVVRDLAPRVTTSFAHVVGDAWPLAMTYKPRVPADPVAIRDLLSRSLEQDRARGFTAEGPHADDFEIAMKDVAARRHASQGQHRAMVLGLKIAELDLLTHRVGRVPLLLLDDVSSELDRARNRRLFELLSTMGGQVFLTTTQPELILIEGNRRDFRIQDGAIVPS